MLIEVDDKHTLGDFIAFTDMGRLRKGAVTKRFLVTNRKNGVILGEIKWFNHWRCYSFYTNKRIVILEKRCLRDIADFVEKETNKRKEK